jgi:hypothetical protein
VAPAGQRRTRAVAPFSPHYAAREVAAHLRRLIERHSLHRGPLQHDRVMAFLVGNREERSRQPKSCLFNVRGIIAKVLGDFGPGCVESLADGFQGLGAEWSSINKLSGLCRAVSGHHCATYAANLAMVAWSTPMVLPIARQLSPAAMCFRASAAASVCDRFARHACGRLHGLRCPT